ncbi:MAG TPA: class I SAM-dependent methyltransferase [Actinomycetota bacterium]|nr:class I SAM-dependent methyltransferase [Actinomycetota bacterium]
MRRLLELCGPPSGRALDVGCGAGFTGFALARAGWDVVYLDPTHEMLLETRAGRRARNLPGEERVVEAWAEAGPFRNGSFRLVVSHRAPHQFRDVAEFLAEARRLTAPGGLVGIADQSPMDGWEEWHNDLERLRDPTHGSALSLSQWNQAFEEAGLQILQAGSVDQPREVESWIHRVGCTDEVRDEILRTVRSMPEDLESWHRPHTDAEGRLIVQAPHAVVVARSPG